MEFQGKLRVGVAQKLACKMIIGRDWPHLYKVLDRVKEAEVGYRQIQNEEGWLGVRGGGKLHRG